MNALESAEEFESTDFSQLLKDFIYQGWAGFTTVSDPENLYKEGDVEIITGKIGLGGTTFLVHASARYGGYFSPNDKHPKIDNYIWAIYPEKSGESHIIVRHDFHSGINNELNCKTGIAKIDNDNSFPQGTGIEAYKQFVFGFLNYASGIGVSIKHSVFRDEFEGQQLTAERWDQIFAPLLSEEGYRKGLEMWTKIYQRD